MRKKGGFLSVWSNAVHEKYSGSFAVIDDDEVVARHSAQPARYSGNTKLSVGNLNDQKTTQKCKKQCWRHKKVTGGRIVKPASC